jgi:rRNA maturation protein Rpf1
MTVEFNHDTLVLVYVKNIITVTKIVQGVEAKNLPKDYKVTVELAKVNEVFEYQVSFSEQVDSENYVDITFTRQGDSILFEVH